MSTNNSQICLFGTEMMGTMTGSAVLIGTLPVSPVLMIFDNQSAVAVQIYVNGTSAPQLWRTFPAGEALILDLRDKAQHAPNFGVPHGTAFYGVGASGNFSISYNYAQNM